MNIKLIITFIFAMTISCASTGFQSGTGVGSIFTSVTEPVSNSSGTMGTKRGESCAINILGWISIGDASIVTASRMGGISKVATVDKKYTNVLFLFGQFCSIVTGE